jgi:sec-independent protein translocase protein TatB
MFDISWGELMLIGVVALIVIGPKELPGVLRMVGQWVGKIRRMAGEFQSQFQEALREAEMADLKKQVDELNSAARGLNTQFDPTNFESSSSTPGKTPGEPAEASKPPEAPATEPKPSAASAQPAAEVSVPPPEAAPPVTAKDLAPEPATATPRAEGDGRG